MTDEEMKTITKSSKKRRKKGRSHHNNINTINTSQLIVPANPIKILILR